MSPNARSSKSSSSKLISLAIQLLCLSSCSHASIVRRMSSAEGISTPATTASSAATEGSLLPNDLFAREGPLMGASSPAMTAEIPLWGKCGPAISGTCAGEARCIYKDPWWSQCRVPINGSWTPSNETWAGTRPNSGNPSSASPAPATLPVASAGSTLEAVKSSNLV